MSSIIYISSDYPIPEIKNPHERSLSIKEALEMGMEVPDYLLKSGIDRNWKRAIQWSDRSICFDIDNGTVEDGDLNDDYAIIPLYAGCMDPSWVSPIYIMSILTFSIIENIIKM